MIFLTLFQSADEGAEGDHILTKILAHLPHQHALLSDLVALTRDSSTSHYRPHINEKQMKGSRLELTPSFKHRRTIETTEWRLRVAGAVSPVSRSKLFPPPDSSLTHQECAPLIQMASDHLERLFVSDLLRTCLSREQRAAMHPHTSPCACGRPVSVGVPLQMVPPTRREHSFRFSRRSSTEAALVCC